MSTYLHVSALDNGHYALKRVGGNVISGIVGEFATRQEAEYAMMRHALFASPDARIMLPGNGQAAD